MGYYADGYWDIVATDDLTASLNALKSFDKFNYYQPKDGETDTKVILENVFSEFCEDLGMEVHPENPNRVIGWTGGKLILNEPLLDELAKHFEGTATYHAEDNVHWRWRFIDGRWDEHSGEVKFATDPLDN